MNVTYKEKNGKMQIIDSDTGAWYVGDIQQEIKKAIGSKNYNDCKSSFMSTR